MPRFKTYHNVFVNNDELFSKEIAEANDGVYLPETWEWDNKSQISVDDVSIWECLFEQSGGTGVYAAWAPYSDFFIFVKNKKLVNTFTAKTAYILVKDYFVKNNIPVPVRYNKKKIKFLEGASS